MHALVALGLLGAEAYMEQRGQLAGEVGMRREGGGDEGLRIGEIELLQIATVGAQDGDVTRGDAGGNHKRIQLVVIADAAPGGADGLLDARAGGIEIDRGGGRRAQDEVAQQHGREGGLRTDDERRGIDHREAHVFEQRDDGGELGV